MMSQSSTAQSGQLPIGALPSSSSRRAAGSEPSPGLTPLACLYHWEATRPNDVHFTQPVGKGSVVDLTWKEILDEVRRVAAYLRNMGFPKGSKIALLGKNSAHWIMADWAIWMAGHVTVPLYPTSSPETVQYVLRHSEARLLFVGKIDGWATARERMPADLPIVVLPLGPAWADTKWDGIAAATAPLQGEPDRRLDELATIVYTSGSTGVPKGVMHTFRAFNVVGTLMRDTMEGAGPNDRMLSYLPLAHVAERVVVENQSTYFGYRVFFAESLETFADDLRRARPTIFFSVPRLWTKFHLAVRAKLSEEREARLFSLPVVRGIVKRRILRQLGLDRVRLAFTGAAPLPAETIEWYRTLGLELLEAYGMSENMAYSHFTRPGRARHGYIGHANLGVECRIGDDGEILVKSPAQMVGYYKDPLRTAESYTLDGFFRTGDMGELDGEGRVRITGRVKDLFKTSKGKYVAPVPIENVLCTLPRVEAACVAGANKQAPFALLMLTEAASFESARPEGRDAIAADLRARLETVNASLEPHEKLAFAVIVDQPWTVENGCLTPTIKIRRSAIEARYESRVGTWFETGKHVVWE
ncbi:MAG: AMP-binding protein [Polyangiaceae bacterium]